MNIVQGSVSPTHRCKAHGVWPERCTSVSTTKLVPTLPVHKIRGYAQFLFTMPCAVHQKDQHKSNGTKVAHKMKMKLTPDLDFVIIEILKNVEAGTAGGPTVRCRRLIVKEKRTKARKKLSFFLSPLFIHFSIFDEKWSTDDFIKRSNGS